MKIALKFLAAALTATSLLSLTTPRFAQASTFGATEVNSEQFVLVAVPYGTDSTKYQLLVIEQISNAQKCWSESGSTPVVIDPLLLNFDFTGICSRSVDSNGYSVRLDSQDLGLNYLLRVVKRNNELVLVTNHLRDRSAPSFEIGRTNGFQDGYLKIELDSGWRLTKRLYEGQMLGHVYLTGESTALGVSPTNIPTNVPAPVQNRPLFRNPPASSSARELIFTRPSTPTMTTPPPSVDDFPAPPPVQNSSPPPTSDRQIPVFDTP